MIEDIPSIRPELQIVYSRTFDSPAICVPRLYSRFHSCFLSCHSFFIGVLQLVYGAIILITSLQELVHPPVVVLGRYHAGIWAGLCLLAIGGFYTVRYWPRR
jgi:hypothetical protein